MKLLEQYVLLVNNYLEKPRNKYLEKRKSKKYAKIVKKYDQALLDKYRYIEKLLDEGLKEEDK